MVTGRIDDKGRIAIPTAVREGLGLEPGDVMVFDVKNQILRIAKVTNPFDALIDEAIDEFESGNTISLRDFATQEGINLE
ncbi:MAG: AbrB/MazE/SpoVT family DNA-binding domain-containing protein [Thermomicrobiales bacterium]|nr:AbrB/MazE/SpoVT family DNA-binding domain-containing protein [Thermomicrobiales bacterium]MCO5229340.1 AbrB/MazE/SpoVT family DNA-binding domain-containing protein [Thermomicrobiales bacterium]